MSVDIIRTMLLLLNSFEALENFLRENEDDVLTDEIEARHITMMLTCAEEFKEGLARQLQLIRDCRQMGIEAALEIFRKKYFST